MTCTSRMWLLIVTCVMCVCAQTPSPTQARIIVSLADAVTKQPVQATIAYLLQGQPNSSVSQTTDAEGRVEFKDLQPGNYGLLLGRALGYAVPGIVDGLIAVKGGDSIDVPILLRRTGSIEGTVVDESGTPIADARLEAIDLTHLVNKPALRIQRTAFTDEKGHFSINDVDPIGVIVRVWKTAPRPNGQRYVTSYYPDANTVAEAKSVTVPVGASVRGINFHLRLSPTFHIRGRIDQGQESVEFTSLTIQPCVPEVWDTPTTLDQVKSSSEGSFDIPALLPGTYCLLFQRKDSTGREIRTFAEQTVAVVDHDVDGIVLTPEQPQDVLVAIATENGAALPPPTRIMLTLGASNHLPPVLSQAIKTGGFRLPRVAHADYRFQVYPAPGTYVKSVKRGYQDLSDGNIRFTDDYGVIVVEMAAAENRVHVRVKKDGHPSWKRILVNAYPVDPPRRSDRTYGGLANECGEYDFSNIAPGTYNIFAWDKFEPVMDRPEFIQRFPSTTVKVTNGSDLTVETNLITSEQIDEAKAKF